MTRDDITRIAREAGFVGFDGNNGSLRRFAALVEDAQSKRMFDEGFVTVGHMRERIAAEREACAKLCDDWPNGRDDVYSIGVAIRARG